MEELQKCGYSSRSDLTIRSNMAMTCNFFWFRWLNIVAGDLTVKMAKRLDHTGQWYPYQCLVFPDENSIWDSPRDEIQTISIFWDIRVWPLCVSCSICSICLGITDNYDLTNHRKVLMRILNNGREVNIRQIFAPRFQNRCETVEELCRAEIVIIAF